MPSGTHHIMAGALFTGTGTVGVNGGHFSVEGAAGTSGACIMNFYDGYFGATSTEKCPPFTPTTPVPVNNAPAII